MQARLMLGAALRRAGAWDEALQILADRASAGWGAQYEAGMALAALGRGPEAAAALRRACELNPRSALAVHALGDQLAMAGDEAGARAAHGRPLAGSAGDPALIEAARSLFDGRPDAAARLRTRFNMSLHDLAAVRLLADAGMRIGRARDVEALLSPAVARAPAFLPGRHALALALQAQGRTAAALAQTEAALAGSPGAAPFLILRAALLAEAGDHAAASLAYEDLVRTAPDEPRLWLSFGHVLKTTGRRPAAVAAYRRALRLSPALGEAYWSLANLKVVRFAPQDADAMTKLLAGGGLSPEDRTCVHFALGKALEDERRFDESFAQYRAGNALHRASHPYDAAAHRGFADRTMATFSAEAIAARTGTGDPACDPIFVVGLPRSGSTLVEQMLSGHPLVEGLSELPHLTALAASVAASGGRGAPAYPGLLLEADAGTLRNLGAAYLARARAHRRTDRPFFVDKFPGNVLHVGLIHLILPRARVIDVRRDPMDCGLSAYKQHFAAGQDYSYDLHDIGRRYADYVELTAHFDAVLPGRVHRVRYEELVRSPRAVLEGALGHCGLDFQDSCLDFHRLDRPVRTASSEQVRRPLSSDPVGSWRNYAPWLGELRDGLAAWRPAA